VTQKAPLERDPEQRRGDEPKHSQGDGRDRRFSGVSGSPLPCGRRSRLDQCTSGALSAQSSPETRFLEEYSLKPAIRAGEKWKLLAPVTRRNGHYCGLDASSLRIWRLELP